MAKIDKFEDIIAWQKAKELTLAVYRIFTECKDYGFKDQIQRSAVSAMNNIAEGFERRTNRELINYLYIAKGSSGEVRSMLYIAMGLHYITDDDFSYLFNLSQTVSKLLAGFIKTL